MINHKRIIQAYIPSLLAFVMFIYLLTLNMRFLINLNAHKIKEELGGGGKEMPHYYMLEHLFYFLDIEQRLLNIYKS